MMDTHSTTGASTAAAERRFQRLLQALRSQDKAVRVMAVEALALIRDSRAAEPLIDALSDTCMYVRDQAAKALPRFAEAQITSWLVAALSDLNDQVRSCACHALGAIGDELAINTLLSTLAAGKTGRDRVCAMMSLPERQSESVVAGLVSALQDADREVRFTSAVCLRESGELGVPALTAALVDPEASVAKAAARSLAHVGTRLARVALAEHLQASGYEVSALVVEPERTIQDARDLSPLIAVLHAQGEVEIAVAVELLGLFPVPQAVNVLLDVLQAGDRTLHYCTADALGRMGELGQRALLSAYRSGPRNARSLAAMTLDSRAGDSAIASLVHVLENETITSAQANAVYALGRIGGDQALAALLRFVSAPAANLRRAVAVNLGHFQGARVLNALVGLLRDPYDEVQVFAAISLAKIGGQEALDALLVNSGCEP
jgi:HEAT repeat protein